MSDAHDSWEKFLNPKVLKGNLISISIFIAAYEIFKDAVIEKPEVFFSNGFDQNGLIMDEKYKTDVLSKSKNKLYASLLWLKEMEAINQSDIDAFDSIRKHRNEVAHELMDFVTNSNRNFEASIFQELINLLKKVETWWFINFEASIDPDILPEGTDPNEVIPGPIWSLQLMLDIALGNEPEEGYYHKVYNENKT